MALFNVNDDGPNLDEVKARLHPAQARELMDLLASQQAIAPDGDVFIVLHGTLANQCGKPLSRESREVLEAKEDVDA